MLPIKFYKYQGTGNDFVLIDQRTDMHLTRQDTQYIAKLCHRRFGIGADGLILLQNHSDYDFEMIYFNADGRESTMCGNGGRCMVAFAKALGIIEQAAYFLAIDGPHRARIRPDNGWVELQMMDVPQIETNADFYYLNTGSPHYVRFVNNLPTLDVVQQGRTIRYNERFRQEGTNVNFVQIEADQHLSVATYERGVEDETLSCGTGVTAAALAYALAHPEQASRNLRIDTKGGQLEVRFEPADSGFRNIWLCGPAEQVFQGEIICN
ncbi:MAG TPA: diaminopimelate epimerase [Saprospiraceae bacterium]|nr:diaminopimelate epimerase [Saprospiraceae bacterium]HMP24043.1 diaminopimelate epimerase [Saprospiraceae bacterium]